MALGGDVAAIKLVLDRICPAPKSRSVDFELPPSLKTPTDVADALDGLLQAAGEGALTPDEASTLSGILETKRRRWRQWNSPIALRWSRPGRKKLAANDQPHDAR
jgi:hypothetical protein